MYCCISNPKSEIANWTSVRTVQSEFSDFGFEMQDSSNFRFPPGVHFPRRRAGDSQESEGGMEMGRTSSPPKLGGVARRAGVVPRANRFAERGLGTTPPRFARHPS